MLFKQHFCLTLSRPLYDLESGNGLFVMCMTVVAFDLESISIDFSVKYVRLYKAHEEIN